MNTLATRWNTILRSQLGIGRRHDVDLAFWLLMASACLFLAWTARLHPLTHDAFHEMAMIRYWHQTGEFPHSDVFAFTPTVSPAVHHEWGMGAILYLFTFFSTDPFVGIGVLKTFCLVVLGLLLYRGARMSGAHPIVLAILAPIIFPVIWVGFSTLRAGMFTMVAIAAQWVMQRYDLRGSRAWIVAWIVLYVIWLNVHAGFVVGIAMLGCHGIERFVSSGMIRKTTFQQSRIDWIRSLHATWHLLLLVPVILLGACVNPWGTDYIPYLIRAITMPRPTMLEWQPLWKTYQPEWTLVCYTASIALAVYGFRSRRWERCFGLLILVLAAYMSLKHLRHGALYGVLWLMIVPAWISSTPLGHWILQKVHRDRQQVIWVSTLVSGICLFLAWIPSHFQVTLPRTLAESPHCYPVDAVEHLRTTGFHGKLLTPFHAGSYVSWSLHPQVFVSVDGRYEVAYRDDVLPKHNLLFRAESGWDEVLREFRPDAILVPTTSPLLEALEQSSITDDTAWRLEYRDQAYAIFQPATS